MKLLDMLKEIFSRSESDVSENAEETLDKIYDALSDKSKQRIEESFEKSEKGDITDPISENGNIVFDIDDAISIIASEVTTISDDDLSDLPDLTEELRKDSSIISDGGFTG